MTIREQIMMVLSQALTGQIDSNAANEQLTNVLASTGEANAAGLARDWLTYLQQAQQNSGGGATPDSMARQITSVLSSLDSNPLWQGRLERPGVEGIGGATTTPGTTGSTGTVGIGYPYEDVVTGGGTGPADLPGATPSELLEAQSPSDKYMRWLLQSPTYQKGSSFLRGTAENKAGDFWNQYWLTQARDPATFNMNPNTGTGQPGQDWLSYLSSGAAKPTREGARGSLQNILGALEAPATATPNPFSLAMGELYGRDVEGGEDQLRDLILQTSGMGMPSEMRNILLSGARRRFKNQRTLQPGTSIQDFARQWGLL